MLFLIHPHPTYSASDLPQLLKLHVLVGRMGSRGDGRIGTKIGAHTKHIVTKLITTKLIKTKLINYKSYQTTKHIKLKTYQ